MSELNDFIAKQHERDLLAEQRWTRVETLLEQNNERLFGGPNQKGALVFLHEESAKLEGATTLITTRVGALETWKSGTLKWVGGVVAVLTLEGSALALYMNHMTAIANQLQSLIKTH